MGFDNDCILNIQSLAGEYFCPVCHLLVYPNEALQAQCTHLYCKPCLTYVVSTTHACPYDGYRVTEADCKPLLESNKTLADTIGKIQVHCLYYRTGCTWQGSLSDCTPHCSTCGFGESPVQCNRCGIQIVHRQVQEHAQNCPGVQPQAQQAGGGDNATSAGSGNVPDAGQTVAPSASQTQAIQAASTTQDSNQQQAGSALQPQAAQAAMPIPEQWYQQQYQQQYQQYYQQYPGYDPYQQQQYQQYYYQYPQAAVQQYQQPPMQTYVQPQSQIYNQAQAQPQVQPQQQGQPHVQNHPQSQPQAPSQVAQPQAQAPSQIAQAQAPSQVAVPQPQPQVQPTVNAQPQAVQSAGQTQPQMQAQQSQGLASNAVAAYNQAQPYAQQQPVPPQQMPVPPQYQQTHSQVQHPYPQSQTQQYPQAYPPSQPAAGYPPSQLNQGVNPTAQLQAPNGVTGYQSYPQPQAQAYPQAQAHQMPTSGALQQVQYPGQIQGQFPQATSQVRPPQPYAAMASQQQPAMMPAQGQTPSGQTPAQQPPVYPNNAAPQAGYPFQQRPGVQAALPQQQYMQQQSFPGQAPYMQAAQLQPPQGPSQTQLQPPPPHPQQGGYVPPQAVQPNMSQGYPGRQPVPQGTGSQPYSQGAAHVGPAHVRPVQSHPHTSMQRANTQMPVSSELQQAVPVQNSFKPSSGGERLHDLTMDKSAQNQNGHSEESRDVKSENGVAEAADGNATKRDASISSGSEIPGSNQVSGTPSKAVETGVQERKPGTNENIPGGVSVPSSGGSTLKGNAENGKDFSKADGEDLKNKDRGKAGGSAPTSMLPQSHLPPQGHESSSFPASDQGRNQLQPMHYGHPAQQRPGLPSIPQSASYPGNPQQSALRGHPPNQFRPQVPGYVSPRPPFNAADNAQAPVPNHHPHENPSGAVLGPGFAGAGGRPGNVGQYQGHVPPYQAGQPQNPVGTGPSLAVRPGAFDSHAGMVGRDPLHRPDMGQQRPPFPADLEKYPGQRPGFFDDRLPDSHPHAPMERGPYVHAPPGGAGKFGGPSAHDSAHTAGLCDERFRPFSEEQLKPFPHREFEDDLRKFPRAPHLEAMPSKFGTQFASSRPLDQVPHQFGVDGVTRPFETGMHGLDCDPGLKADSGVGPGPSRFLPPLRPNEVGERARPLEFPDDMGRPDFGRRPGPGFGQHRMDGLPSRSPGGDYASFPSRPFGGYRDIDGNDSRSFEGSKPFNFPGGETFGKLAHEGRFPVPPNHLHRGEVDVPGNLRMGDPSFGDPRGRDMLPSQLRRGEHMGPRNLHLGEGAAFSRSAGPSRIGELQLAGSFPQHLPPFGESFGGEKPGHPFGGEPGYRGGFSLHRHARDVGFYPGEMEPFDNLRKRKPASIMCRICKVECGTVEGLDLHSQSREHQRRAMDMALSIKQQNKRKKTSKDQASAEEGRDGEKPKTSTFGGCGNRR